MKKVLKSEYAWVMGIVLIGISLSIFLSAYISFWIDESMVVNLSYENNSTIISELLIKEAHPPIYYFLIKAIRIIFGDKELYFRLISFLFFGLISIYVFLLGREIGGKSTGFFSLILWSSNYFLLFYSKQARPYAMLAFLSVASLYYFYHLLILKDFRTKNIGFYLIFTIIGLYTNYWFVLILLSQLIILFITDIKIENRKIWLILISAGLSFLPWAILYLIKFKNYSVGEFISKPNLGTIWESLVYFGWGQWWLIIPASICCIIYGTLKKNLDLNKIKWLIYYFFIVIGLAFLISQFVPIYTPGRREIVLVPIFIITISYIFSRIEDRWWQISVSVLMILFTYQTILGFNAQANAWQSSDISLMQEVQTQAKKEDYFVVYKLTDVNVSYYGRRLRMNNNKIYFSTTTISQIDHGKFFVFLTDDNVSSSVIKYFDSNMTRVGEIIPKQPHMPTWINRVIIYEKS